MDVILLGEIQSLIDGVNTNIANAKSVIDTINNNTKANNTASETGTLSQKLSSIISYTKTNNTASTTGTLSQKISSAIANTAATTTENASGTLSAKLTYLINRRDKIVTPSNTNIKTLASNVTVVTEKSSKNQSKNSSTYSCYVKHDGTYRVYVTGSSTLTEAGWNAGTSTAYNGKPEYTIYANSSSIGQKTNSAVGDFGVAISSTTKTIDMYCVRGDMLYVYITCKSTIGGHPCIGEYCTGKWTFTFSDISIRGTSNEVNSMTT